eukprot:GEMP01043628.1.p1 GENE.GEMP01043628.1~~GEMP01043628.1.p1  ORF type:complete len:180 (+),score=38.22 GEMP01043628.1:194-733(+)
MEQSGVSPNCSGYPPSEACFNIRFADPLGNRRPRIFDSSDPTVTFPMDRESSRLWYENRTTTFLPHRHSYHICHHINPADHRKVCITNSPSYKGLWQNDWSPPGKLEHIQAVRSLAHSGSLSRLNREKMWMERRTRRLRETPVRKQQLIERCVIEAKQSPSPQITMAWRDSPLTAFLLK